MKKLFLTLAVGIMLLTVDNAYAQEFKRIQFAKGGHSAVVKGMTGFYGVSYLVRAKAGQKMAVTLTPAKGVGVRVSTDDGAYVLLRIEQGGGPYGLDLSESGDYEIVVGSISHRSVPFTLTVKIE